MVKLVSIKSRFLFVQYFPQVIEYSLPPPEEPQLIDLTVRQFVASVPISSRFSSSSTDPPPPPLSPHYLPQQCQEVHVSQVGARTAAPGGGSVSALLAALGAGLGSMVAEFLKSSLNLFFFL